MKAELHPQAQALLAGPLKVASPLQVPELSTLRSRRPEIDDLLVGGGEDVFKRWDGLVPVGSGQMAVRWYQPRRQQPDLLTVFVHGGGWVAGTLESHDALCRSLALRSDGAVVSLQYSLSPEARYPVALNEVQLALSNAAELAAIEGLTIRRVVAVGDSAGGNLVAGALHRMASQNQKAVMKGVFIYPVIDTSMDHDSWKTIGSAYNLTAARMRWYWDQYLGESWRQNDVLARSPDISPIRSDQLCRFPESLVVTATHDPLNDEGTAFFRRLVDAGVSAQHIEVPGQIHGFLRFRRALTDETWGADAVMGRIGAFLQA